jgi:DNA polymerase III epsilon subunit-like protein
MLSLGAVEIETGKEFYIEIKPFQHGEYLLEAMEHNGFTFKQVTSLEFGTHMTEAMGQFNEWLDSLRPTIMDRLVFVSDNAGFDWQFVNYYFHEILGQNPFGYSSLSLTSLYKGYAQNLRASFKHLRTEPHTHNALEDARGNAGAFRTIMQEWTENRNENPGPSTPGGSSLLPHWLRQPLDTSPRRP